MNRWVFE